MRTSVSLGIITVVATGSLMGISWFGLRAPEIPSFHQVQSSYLSSDLFLLDRKGEILHQLRQNSKVRSYQWLPSEKIPAVMTNALIKSEDRHFYSHQGVDLKGLAASLYQRVFKKSERGGSTLSMQLVKLLVPQKSLWEGYYGKVRQVKAAWALEESWSKKQILEAYLNLVPFRGEYQGLSSATQALYHKMPEGLTFPEATLLSVLIRSPNATKDVWLKRACWQEREWCPAMGRRLATLAERSPPMQQHALHVATRLSQESYKGVVQTTIDKELQLQAQELIRSQMQTLQEQNVHDASILVLENKTGEVWAYVGSSGDYSSAPFVDGVRSLRQAGSTLKPFLYATAFEKNILHANSWIEDSAVDIVFDRGVYKPQNHDRQFYGWVQAKTALGSSLNVPAVKVFRLLNDESFWNKLQALHFRGLKNSDHYGPALALGVADVTLEDLTQAYRTLANRGVYTSLRFIKAPDALVSSVVFKPDAANEVLGILSENQNRTLGFGMDSTLAVPGTAVKTGTSKDMRDNWAVGMNSRFTVGVWVGNFTGEPMYNVMGVTGAAPIWKKTMEWLNEHYPSAPLQLPLAKNNTPTSAPQAYPKARIIYPQEGMVLAIDPDIPLANQKMPLMVQAPEKKKLSWKIDGKPVVSKNNSPLWQPTTGKHTFELYEGEDLNSKVQILVK